MAMVRDDDWDWEADLWNQSPSTFPQKQPNSKSTNVMEKSTIRCGKYSEITQSQASTVVEPKQIRGRPIRRNHVEKKPGDFNGNQEEIRAYCGLAVSNELIERMINTKLQDKKQKAELLPNLSFTSSPSTSIDDNGSQSSQSNFVSCCSSSSDLDPSVPEFVPTRGPARGRGRIVGDRDEKQQPGQKTHTWAKKSSAQARQRVFNINDADDFPALK